LERKRGGGYSNKYPAFVFFISKNKELFLMAQFNKMITIIVLLTVWITDYSEGFSFNR
jgi:hypothetical protein